MPEAPTPRNRKRSLTPRWFNIRLLIDADKNKMAAELSYVAATEAVAELQGCQRAVDAEVVIVGCLDNRIEAGVCGRVTVSTQSGMVDHG